ncbi:MAG: S8 family serine peptidase [Phycisphaeraceae bacterium]|nr:S8 family serine peptidase [Phycisphaeraceae bacterium]
MKLLVAAFLAAVVTTSISLAAATNTATQPTPIQFRTGPAVLSPLADGPGRTAPLAAIAGKNGGHAVVQFSGPVSLADRGVMEAAGLRLQNPLGSNAFFASVSKPDIKSLDQVASLIAVSAIRPEWKLHPFLADMAPPAYTVVAGKDQDAIVAVNVMFHADDAMGLTGIRMLQKYKATVIGELRSLPVMVAEMPLANILALAGEDSVMWIESPYPAMSVTSVATHIGAVTEASKALAAAAVANDSNRARVGADTLNGPAYSLDGAGIRPFVYDAGSARLTHQTFSSTGGGGQRIISVDGASVSSHSTHVAGTVAGNGAGEGGNIHRGMAPAAFILSGALNTGVGTGTYFLYDRVCDLEADYTLAFAAPNSADIANNSIGTNTETNGFPCSLQGDYGVTDALLDSLVRGSLGRPIRVVWANGNERQGNRCDVEGFGDYFSTAPPATAKNHITVGALNSNNDSMTTFSSWGPTDDGRLKPDISAPGCQSDGDNTVTSSTSASDTSYGGSCGTSMACPTVTGVSTLLLQQFRRTFPGADDPRNSTLKLWLTHTALDLLTPGPDYQTGYGSMRGIPAADFVISGAYLEAQINQGETFQRTIEVAGGQPLKISLAWDDAPGTPNTTGASTLVNDLDLRLIAPNDAVFYPWTLDPANPSAAAVRTTPNRRDNIEQVLVDNPMPGTWRVEVIGFNVPQGAQPFSLAGVPGSYSGLSLSLVTQIPTLILPGSPLSVDVDVLAINQSLVPGSVKVYTRTSTSDPFTSAPMSLVTGNRYRANLTAPLCGSILQVYFAAEGDASGAITLPNTAPASLFVANVGETNVAFADNFETDQGWTVANTPIAGGTFAGAWERGVPITPAATGAPSVDGDGSGSCYVTANNSVSPDVDWGFTALTSPQINAPNGPLSVSYKRWFHRTSSTAGGDVLRVEYSLNNGATWTDIEVFGSASGTITGSWISQVATIPVGSSQLRLRFTANDNATNSTSVEAAVDAVMVTSIACTNPQTCIADWDHDTFITPSDVAAFINQWSLDLTNGTLLADVDQSGTVDPSDIATFIQAWLAAVANGC